MRLSGSAVLEELSGCELAEWLREIEAMAQAAGYKVKAEAEQGFRDWLAEALKGGASAAHRATNGAGALPPPPEEMLEDGVWISDPKEVMELRAKKWCKVWQKRPTRLGDIRSVGLMLRGLALQQISEGGHAEIEKGPLVATLKSFSKKTSKSLSGWSPPDLLEVAGIWPPLSSLSSS